MASEAVARPDLVSLGDARPAFPVVHLDGHGVLSCGELAGPADVFGLSWALPVTAVQRGRECGTDGHLAGALRELTG